MKKIFLILLMVGLIAFLFISCTPTVPTEGEGEGEGEVEICPTVSVATEVEISGKKYIKDGSRTITVTFTEATEPVSVYVGTSIKDNPVGVPSEAVEVVMYADADKKVYTGKYAFGSETGDCDVGYIYVVTCATCAPCKYAYTVDNVSPCSEIKIYEDPTTGCPCGGVNIRFLTPETTDCGTYTCCGDYCTGLDTYSFDLYKSNPFGTCCDIPCISPVATCSGTGCDIDCTLSCFDFDLTQYVDTQYVNKTIKYYDFYLVATLTDKVGNKTYYYAKLTIYSKLKAKLELDVVSVKEYVDDVDAGNCTTWSNGAVRADGVIGACVSNTTGICGSVTIDP